MKIKTVYKDEDVHSVPFVEAYMTAIPQKRQRIHSIRDSFNTPGAFPDEIYRPSEAHMTVMPKFKVPQKHVHKLTNITQSLDVPKTVKVMGAGVYPSIKSPRVILLNSIVDFEQIRNRLKRFIDENNCKTYSDPSHPHITMFLATNNTEARQIPKFSKKYLQEKVSEYQNCWRTNFKTIRLEISVPK